MEVHFNRTTCLITTKQILATTLAQKCAFLKEETNIQKELVAIYGQLGLKVALNIAAIIEAEAGGLMPLPL